MTKFPSYSMCRCGKESGPDNGGDFICKPCQLSSARETILELQGDLASLGKLSLACARENLSEISRLREREARYEAALTDARSTRDAAVEQLAGLRAQLADAVENRDVAALERLEVQRKHYESRIRTLLIERNGAVAELEELRGEENTPGADLAAALASGLAPQGPGRSALEAVAILSELLNTIVKHPHIAPFVKPPPMGDVYDQATVTPSE